MLTYLFTVYNKGKEISHLSQFSQPNVGKSNFEYLKMLLQYVTDFNQIFTAKI